MKTSLHKGGDQDWSLSARVLQELRARLKPGMRTLETGAGHSTLTFAQAGCVHTAITPSTDEIARIKSEAQARGVPLASVTFIPEMSQDALPRLRERFDLVLIDGGHGFPIPQIDFQYCASMLNVGGVLVLDDIALWPVRTVRQFLMSEPGWEHVGTFDAKTSFFVLKKPYSYEEWRDQPYSEVKSRLPRYLGYAHRGLAHLARGNFLHAARALQRKLATRR